MQLSAGGSKLLAYWGTIQAGVAQRVGTAELWAMVKFAATDEGFDISGASAIDMGQLRALAAGNRNAATNLANAGPNEGLTGAMIGKDLAGELRGYQLPEQQWLARFEHTTIVDGQEVTTWRTSLFGGLLPPSKQELQMQLDADGEILASEYDTVHVSIGDIALTAL